LLARQLPLAYPSTALLAVGQNTNERAKPISEEAKRELLERAAKIL
jgi:hypothetical protein